MQPMKEKVLDWFANGEKGVSSEAMARAVCDMTSNRRWHSNHPSDPDDLRRCVLFLDAVPEARNHMDKVAALSETWAALVSNWAELEEMLREELPLKRAPKTYARMKQLGC